MPQSINMLATTSRSPSRLPREATPRNMRNNTRGLMAENQMNYQLQDKHQQVRGPEWHPDKQRKYILCKIRPSQQRGTLKGLLGPRRGLTAGVSYVGPQGLEATSRGVRRHVIVLVQKKANITTIRPETCGPHPCSYEMSGKVGSNTHQWISRPLSVQITRRRWPWHFTPPSNIWTLMTYFHGAVRHRPLWYFELFQ